MSDEPSWRHKFGTFSIVGRCPRTNMFGVAVSSKFLGVGAVCSHARAGVGAVATQALINPYLGSQTLDLLAQGLAAEKAIRQALAGDDGQEMRQLIVIDQEGHATAFTGSEPLMWRGHLTGPNYAVAGNILVG